MLAKQFILDTETTGIRVEDGHRIIEIGCLEMIDRKLTGRHFHHYFNPEREVEAGALAVHGISNEFLKDKILFKHKAQEFIELVSGAELIIHNAPFDVSFLNHELSLSGLDFKPITEYCKVIDTLTIARKLHVGQRNNLDALCKRYGVDNTKREMHGALLDAHLLAQVYLAMTGGQGSFFDALSDTDSSSSRKKALPTHKNILKHPIKVILATAQEIQNHLNYLKDMKQIGNCLWLEEE